MYDGRLITLIELYSIRPITPPSVERFRFENHDAEFNFIERNRSLHSSMYGVRLTDRAATSTPSLMSVADPRHVESARRIDSVNPMPTAAPLGRMGPFGSLGHHVL